MNRSLITFLLLATMISVGCASGPKTRSQSDNGSGSGPNGSATTYGPDPTDANQPPISYGPVPVQLRPVTLVLGPGMARGFAHAGALRALAAHKIPIGAIYGSEMGSLIGALYAADSNINAFEWNLIRIKDEIFTSGGGLLKNIFASENPPRGNPQKLDEQLREIFGKKDIAQAKIPLRIEIQKKSATSPLLLDKGAMTQALRAAMALPGFFEPAPIDGQPALAASDPQSVTYLCAEARAIAGGPVVLIDTSVARNDPSAADLVIRPNLEGIAPTDFSKKSDAAFRGKKAVEEHLAELNRWVGIAETDKEKPTP